MKLETLVATIDQKDHTLVEKMNIQTGAVIGNQCGQDSVETFLYKGNPIVYHNTAQRGVGRNRNLLMDNMTGDICVMADDDMRFVDGYPQIAQEAFDACPRGDVLIFNLIEKTPRRYVNRKITRVRWYSYAKYGAARLAFRRAPLQTAGIRFSLLFGGGAKYGSGEDTIFLRDCLKKGLRIYAVPYALAEIDQTAASTWFTGYNETFFFDKGVVYKYLHPAAWLLYDLRFLLCYRKKHRGGLPLWKAMKRMLSGSLSFSTQNPE